MFVRTSALSNMMEPSMSDFQQPISTETALRLLASLQRRQILRRVADTPDGTTLEQLKTHLRERDSAQSHGNGTDDHQLVQLHHVHLPMLAEANVITYDAAQGDISRGDEFQTVFSLLEAVDNHKTSICQCDAGAPR